jgi:hypothetical protein
VFNSFRAHRGSGSSLAARQHLPCSVLAVNTKTALTRPQQKC